jgi:Cu/Zn superoxide dismutase
MRWAYYGGEVTDYEPNVDLTKYPNVKPDIFEGARASAIMIGMDGRSFFRLRVSGIDATSGTYGVHLHQGPCDADFPGDLPDGAGPHYNVSWESIKGLLGPNIKKTEVWLDLNVESDGDARSTATVDFIPEGNRSIVLHGLKTADDGTAGPRLACLPFNIKAYASGD